jgi:hypothetical protein
MNSSDRTHIFTQCWSSNSWGSRESVSGPTSTLARTATLRAYFPELLETLEIQKIFDAGCGDFGWLGSLSLPGVQILGADIVQPLIETLQATRTSETTKFQVMDIISEPPEEADMWLLRDVLCLYPFSDCLAILERFLESNSRWLAVTSVEGDKNHDAPTGLWRPLSLTASPFDAPQPVCIVEDGEQWFRKRYLYVFSRGQVEEWVPNIRHVLNTIGAEVALQNKEHDTRDRNAHLTSNVRLRDVKLHGRTA